MLLIFQAVMTSGTRKVSAGRDDFWAKELVSEYQKTLSTIQKIFRSHSNGFWPETIKEEFNNIILGNQIIDDWINLRRIWMNSGAQVFSNPALKTLDS